MSRRRALTAREAAIALALVVAAGVVVLVASPVHRGFYFRPGTAATARAATTGLTRVLPVPALPLVGGARPGAAAVANVVTTKRPALVPDRDGRLRVPLTDELPRRLPASGVPAGWEVWAFAGAPDVELVRDEPGLALRLRSEASSFALYRDVVVDLDELPVLAWSWRAMRLPPGGDVRQRHTDDQAAQVYVVFPRWPSPRTQSDVIGYVWDTTVPAGTTVVSPQAPNVRIVVVESGAANLGSWRRYTRDVRDDYQALFGHKPPRVGSIAVMIDANDTHGRAEALVADLTFQRRPARAEKTQTFMLR